jgi:putative nucleotidyltransferase with HDIG domain
VLSRWLYRSRQFFEAFLGRVSKRDMAEARRVLGPLLYTMFAALPGPYRLHGLAVYRRVLEAGCHDTNVWQAALLHDAGKYDPSSGRSITLVHRVIIVLLKATPMGRPFLAKLVEFAEARGPSGPVGYLLYPFYLSKHHARLGARMSSEHGAAPEVVRMIEEHHKYRGQSPALLALQAADERS